MSQKTKFLLTDEELSAFVKTNWLPCMEKFVKNDSTWGFNGSDDLNVIYLSYELPTTQLINIGMDIQNQLKTHERNFNPMDPFDPHNDRPGDLLFYH